MNYAKVLDTIEAGQVAKRIHEDIGTCNDRIVAMFFDGEHFGFVNEDEGKFTVEWSIVLCAEIVYKSKWVFTSEHDSLLKI